MADGAFTLIVMPAASLAAFCESVKPPAPAKAMLVETDGVADDGALGVLLDGALGVADGLGADGMLGLGAVAIFGRLELVGVLGAENDGLEI